MAKISPNLKTESTSTRKMKKQHQFRIITFFKTSEKENLKSSSGKKKAHMYRGKDKNQK